MAAKIRILHIIKSLGRGGAETLLPETLHVHDQQKFEFHYIYFLPWKDQMVESLRVNGGRVVCLPARSNIHLMLRARAVISYARRHDIQLIHAHLPWAGIVARIVGRLTGIPVVYTEHNKQERYHILTRTMNLLTMPWLTKIIPVSMDVEQSIRKRKPNLAVPIVTVLNGVNVEKFRPDNDRREEIRRQFRIPNDSFVIGTIAVFRFQKRLDVWLDIAKQILSHEDNVRFIIVGDGPLKAMLLETLEKLKLSDRVFFAGLQTEVRPYLAAFDTYMMSSIFEGLPIAMLEAMSTGLPIITTNAGGIKEVIQHNQNGLLCDVDNPSVLTDFALQLYRDVELRKRLSLEARETVIKNFSMEKMVKQLEGLYLDVLR